MINLKRAYEAASSDDGFRILVDRLWPRGMSKAKGHLDLWLKDIAPSADLKNLVTIPGSGFFLKTLHQGTLKIIKILSSSLKILRRNIKRLP